jgi:bla regulator protein BlaR1
MIAYFIKTIACSAVFLLVYLLLLEREKMHRFNRWYLLGAVVISFIIPLIKIQASQEIIPAFDEAYIINWEPGNITATQAVPTTTSPSNGQVTAPLAGFKIPIWLLLYGSITLLLLIRFCRNIYRLAAATWSRKIIRYNGISLVIVKGDISSYTFFNTIFISEADYPTDGSESPILTHEMAHVRQKHSWDVLFIGVIKVFCWFNPLFISYKKAIQLNHEFLADEAVIKEQTDIPSYQHLLLDKISRGLPLNLTSSFNYSITKKRLTMMMKQSNRSISLIKQLSIIPLLALIAFLFCSREMIAQEKKAVPAKTAMIDIQRSGRTDTTHKIPPMVYFKIMYGNPDQGPGATSEELAEYTAIINRNLKKTGTGTVSMPLTQEEKTRMYRIYSQMSFPQRAQTKIIFIKRSEPVEKVFPTAALLEKWKNPASYGVWIDGKKVTNEKLNDYRYTDFSHYDASNLNYTEKMKQDVMKTYNLKVMYKVQVDLMTNQGYEKYYKASMAEPLYSMFYHEKNDSPGKSPRHVWTRIPEQKESR